MPGKARVHQIAQEFGVDSKVVLARLKGRGEFVKSASSTIEAPVAARLREALTTGKSPQPVPRTTSCAHCELSRPEPSPAPPPFKRKRREWYRGEPLPDFTKRILDEYIVARADPEFRPKGAAYFEDEVNRARETADEWAATLLEGLTIDDVLLWIESDVVVRAKDAPALHRAGIHPTEIGWNYEDRGQQPLGERLFFGHWTVEQVINEVMGRRQRAS